MTTPETLSEYCSVRFGGHEWDAPDDTDQAPTSYCVACGMQGRDYLALRALRLRLAEAEKAMSAALGILQITQMMAGGDPSYNEVIAMLRAALVHDKKG